jgi:MoaA/NifB/PqqE/SkfB family radical SAM enzyme
MIKRITLGLTTVCNLNKETACALCFRATCKQNIPKINMDIDVIKNALNRDVIKNLKELIVCGSFGEPTLYPHLFEFFNHLSENINHDLKVVVDTNGSTHNEKWWKKFGEIIKGIDHEVRFGIDGLDGVHQIYRVGSDFNKVTKNMEAFASTGACATWKFIAFKHNEHQVEEAKKMARDLGCKKMSVIISCFYNERFKRSDLYIDDRTINIPTVDNLRCKSKDKNWVSIEADGEVMPCTHYKIMKSQLWGQNIYWDDPLLMLKYIKCKDKLNINKSSIEDAEKSDFFKHLHRNYKNMKWCNLYCVERGIRETIINKEFHFDT